MDNSFITFVSKLYRFYQKTILSILEFIVDIKKKKFQIILLSYDQTFINECLQGKFILLLANFLPFVQIRIFIQFKLINYLSNYYNLVLDQDSNFHSDKLLILTPFEL
jgi:hypothetical protein